MRIKTRILRGIRAVSPVLSVLLMIIVAVAGSLVTYAWVMGYIGFTTNKAGKALQIQSVAVGTGAETGNIFVYVQNVGDGTSTLDPIKGCLYINDELKTPETPSGPVVLNAGDTVTLKTPYSVTPGDKVKVKVVSTDGSFMEYTSYPAGGGPGGGGPTQYTLSINVAGSGSVTKSPDKTSYISGEAVTLEAVPDLGCSFTGWSEDLSGSENPTQITMDGDKVVNATFTQNDYSIAVTVNPSPAAGSVAASSPGPYHYNDVITLTPTANPGYTFSSWSGDGTNGAGNTRVVTVTSNMAVTATFTQNEYTLTINTAGSGSVSKNPNQATYHLGETVQLTANPAGGWAFTGWSGDLSGSTNPANLVIDETPQVTATFTQIVITRTSTSTSGFTGVQAGDLLVVIANTRTGTFTTGTLTASATGYTTQQVASYMTDTGNRRAVAILTRVATGSESGSVTVSWGGSGVTTYATLYQVFRMNAGTKTWTKIANGANHGTGTSGTSMTVPSTALPGGSTVNVLSIGAMVWRDDPGTPSFSNLANPYSAVYSSCYSTTEYNYGLPVTTTSVTWPTPRLGSGLLVQFAIS